MKTIYIPINADLFINKIIISEIDDDDAEHMAYLIEIDTSDGVISITGNHDDGPNLQTTDLLT